MQAALDSDGADAGEGSDRRQDHGRPRSTRRLTAYFTALYTNNDAKSVAINATYTPPSGGKPATILVNGSGNVTTDFMKVAGFPTINFDTSSTSIWGNVRMRVALALDVTGSMDNDGKMDAMKPAAKALIDQIAALAKNPGDVYISIIPFAKDVNVGASNITRAGSTGASGTTTTGPATGSTVEKTCTPKNHNTWNGCVTDRDQDYDTQNTAPT